MANGLISLPPVPASPAGSTVISDGWYPDVDVNAVRERMRVGTVVTHDRLRAAIIGALLTVQGELAVWAGAHAIAGIASLADVPSATIAGQSRLVQAWHRAVDHFVMADLAETHRDIGVTQEGSLRSEDMAATADDYRRNATHAIRDILGVGRTSVALI